MEIKIKNRTDLQEYIALSKVKKAPQDHTILVSTKDFHYRDEEIFLDHVAKDFDRLGVKNNGKKIAVAPHSDTWLFSCLFRNADAKITIKNGLIHNDTGPAIVANHGKKQTEIFAREGIVTREDGPAITCVSAGKTIKSEWVKNKSYHRVDGPAVESDSIKEWYNNGYRHNLKGPAWAACGVVRFFINGKEISRKEKSIAFNLFMERKDQELESYLSCIALKYGM